MILPEHKPDHQAPHYARRPNRMPEHKPDYKAPGYARRLNRMSEHKPRLRGEMRENDRIPEYKPYKKEGK